MNGRRFLICGVGMLLAMAPALRAKDPSAALQMELSAALADFDAAQQSLAMPPDAARSLFRAAAQRLEGLSARVVNGRLEYNIGNAYLQAGDLGRAILHYHRAKRLVPRDPLLVDNLREARSRCLTPIRTGHQERILRSVLFWHDQTSPRERAVVALIAFVLIWVALTIRLFVPRRAWSVLAIAGATVFVAGAASVATHGWTDRNAPRGVVVAMDVPAYKGPGSSYQRQFEQPLQPGVEFTRRERRGNWWRIELADGKMGWIDAINADLVPTTRTLGIEN